MAITFKLEHPDGTPADPPRSDPPSRTGKSVPDRPAFVVVGLRAANDPEQHALLVVETG
jgi:hypothetical protein